MRFTKLLLAVPAMAMALFSTGCSGSAARCVSADGLFEVTVPREWTRDSSPEKLGATFIFSLNPDEKGVGDAEIQVEELDLSKQTFEAAVESDMMFEIYPDAQPGYRTQGGFSIAEVSLTASGDAGRKLHDFLLWVKVSDSRAWKVELSWFSPLLQETSDGIQIMFETLRLKHPGAETTLRTNPMSWNGPLTLPQGEALLEVIDGRVRTMGEAQ